MPVRVNVIYGPPCGGKSTHVMERIGEHDVVYDYDRILAAVTARKYHTTDKHVAHQIVIDFRARLLDRLHAAPEIEHAFIITRWPMNALMESLAGLAVEYTRIEATKAECYARLDADATRPARPSGARSLTNGLTNTGTLIRSPEAKEAGQ